MHSMPASTARRASVPGATAGIGSRRVVAPSNRPPARRHLSKNGARSHTRSLMRGRLRSGSMTSRPSPATSFTWLRHVHRARPFTVIAHEPHTPTRHAKRYASAGSRWRWIQVTTSSTVWFSAAGTS